MKKLNILLVTAVLAAMTLFSCKDESGEFVEQLYTNAQKETAIKACLKVSVDTAVAHLFVRDGFYGDMGYQIYYPALQTSLFDTLANHGYGSLTDSLILYTNRLAEDCGSQVKSAFKAAVDSLKIVDYDALINGNEDAITRYFELYEYQTLKSSLRSPVSVRMGLFKVTNVWNEMNKNYVQYSTVPLNFDIQDYIVECMLEAMLTEMRVEEMLVRQDPDHRTSEMDVFGK